MHVLCHAVLCCATHRDHALPAVLVPPRVRLVVIPAPAQHALLGVVGDARVACEA